jgi:hypothetical protein
MYRTHAALFKYYIPILLIAGIALALWQIAIPWYILLILVPLAIVLLVLLAGRRALARETWHSSPAADAHPEPLAPNREGLSRPDHEPAAAPPGEAASHSRLDKRAN